MTNIVAFLGEPSAPRNPPVWEWVKESKVMAVVWTAMRSGSGSGGFFTYMMSGSAGGVLHALFAIVILVMWRTSSWIGADGLLAGYRQRHRGEHVRHMHLPHVHHPHLPWERGTAGTAGGRGKAA